ncbi:MAG TPA: hypothetical protein VNA15_02365 [Candidatus Angelobacter sp.]|nr:hypothetical protein [Candidatus Angelobacter sp.]
MGLVKWARKTVDRNRRSRKAISTIMANLTMLIIVVSLSSLLFIWAVSSFGAYQGGAGYWFSSRSVANQERMSVEGVYFYTSSSINYGLIYVRNVGTIPFTIVSVYINSTLYNSPATFPALQVNVSQVAPICPSTNGICGPSSGGINMHFTQPTLGPGDTQTVTIATQRGTVITTTWVS